MSADPLVRMIAALPADVELTNPVARAVSVLTKLDDEAFNVVCGWIERARDAR